MEYVKEISQDLHVLHHLQDTTMDSDMHEEHPDPLTCEKCNEVFSDIGLYCDHKNSHAVDDDDSIK